jgi:hypothetical protein
MKELIIRHIPAQDRRGARVSVSYRAHERAQPQTAPDAPFGFEITAEQHRLIQWYLEEYLQYPWGEFNTRAQSAEALLDDLGRKLFDTVFRSTRARTLYGRIADDLTNTRIVVRAEATDAAGLGLPWELLRDPDRELGRLASLAHAGNTLYRGATPPHGCRPSSSSFAMWSALGISTTSHVNFGGTTSVSTILRPSPATRPLTYRRAL